MHPFTFERARDPKSAIEKVSDDPRAAFIAGGTELINWLKEGIARPDLLVDVNAIPLSTIEIAENVLHIGALARMSDVAAHRDVRLRFPAIAEALEASASMQLRNMASMGGNLLQRTRCPYFRAETELPCNKRAPGSGCSARTGSSRVAAIFGWSEACVATHPSDVAVALTALDATVRLRGAKRERAVPLVDFYRLPDGDAVRETVIEHGELIVGIDVPVTPLALRSRYVKIRERASYEFALVSVAAAVELDGDRVGAVRIALGGVAPKPWRLLNAEKALAGTTFSAVDLRNAIEPAFADARPLPGNAFKVELAKRAVVRALLLAGGAG
jgi:xanthine dehydrogenase YagS FAD-binding subunit